MKQQINFQDGETSKSSQCNYKIKNGPKKKKYFNKLLYKTKLCVLYLDNGGCPKGKQCPFAHSK